MPVRKPRSKAPAVELDDRTSAMSDEALLCRTFGHKWERRSSGRAHALELIKSGLVEYYRYCDHGCGSTWRQVWDIRRKEIVETQRSYPKNGEYLVPTGRGRLPRGEAFLANFVRENPGLI